MKPSGDVRSAARPSCRAMLAVGLIWLAGITGGVVALDDAEAPGSTELLTEDLARKLVDDVVAEVERIRDLKFKQSVPVHVVNDDVAREHMLRRLDKFQARDVLAALEQAYKLIGLLPPDVDMLEAYMAMLREQAGGFYDPSRKAYYLLDDMPAALAPMLTAHELTHALEDQHYDLDKRLQEVLEDDDRLFARGAVHEGSATLLMTLFTAQKLLRGEVSPEALSGLDVTGTEAIERLPPVLRRQMVGTYVLGLGFVSRGNLGALAHGFPADDVNRLYEDGPRSSEQILHPEKYWDEEQRDDPRRVALPGVGKQLGRKWKRVAEGVLGELSLGVLVGAETPIDQMSALRGPAAWTNAAASGWAGDRWELWRRKKTAVVLLLTVWDTPEDASEFAAGLPDREAFIWRLSEDRVAIVAGESHGKAETVLEALVRVRVEAGAN